jgi:hypothetical protein
LACPNDRRRQVGPPRRDQAAEESRRTSRATLLYDQVTKRHESNFERRTDAARHHWSRPVVRERERAKMVLSRRGRLPPHTIAGRQGRGTAEDARRHAPRQRCRVSSGIEAGWWLLNVHLEFTFSRRCFSLVHFVAVFVFLLDCVRRRIITFAA